MAMTIQQFREALAVALTNCPPQRKRILKKKLLKNKISLTELEAFIAKYAQDAYLKMHQGEQK